MKERGERGNRDRGLVGEKEKGQGGFGQLAIPFLPPPHESRQRQGRGAARHGRPVAIPGEPDHRGGRAVGQNEEGVTGIRFPYLPWAEMVRGGGSSGGGGLEVVVLGVAAL
jgi:hypothetical protein